MFKIWVKAIDDSAAEGPRVALISHSIITANPDVPGPAADRCFRQRPRQRQAGPRYPAPRRDGPDVFAPDTSTEVLEGASGFSDAYSVALTAKPCRDEEVTVTLSSDGRRSPRCRRPTGLTHLTFTDANWNTPQIVLVNAVDDSIVEGTELSTITHQIASTGGKYSALPDRRLPETDRDGL